MNDALIAGGAGLLGGVLENFGNARQARLNRQFQERMANTAVQRRVKDLTAAGLNPAMAYEQQAQSPAGAQATMTDPIAKGVSNAMAARQLQANLDQTKAATDKLRAEATSAATDAEMKKFDLMLRQFSQDGIPSWMDEQLAKRLAGIRDAPVFSNKLREESLLVPAQRAKLELESRLLEGQVPRSELLSVLFGGARDYSRMVDRGFRDNADGVFSSAKAWSTAFESYMRGVRDRASGKFNTKPPR